MTNVTLSKCLRLFYNIGKFQVNKRVCVSLRYYSSSLEKCLPFVARNYGNKHAIIDTQQRYSYNDLLDLSFGLKDILSRENTDVSIGDRIAFLTPRNALYVLCQWATWLSGCISVPLCAQHPSSEIEYILRNSETSVVISTSDYSEIIDDLAKKLDITHVRLLPNNLPKSCNNFEENNLVKQSGIIIHTSGTTGRPKGAVHTYYSLNSQVQSLSDEWEITENDVVLHVMPLHHIHGIVNLLMCPLTCGATVVMEDGFDPERVWNHLLQNTKPEITLLMAVPTIYVKLIEYFDKMNMDPAETRKRCKNVRLMVSGSSALPVSVLQRWQEITGHILLERYGMTEIGMGLTNPYRGERKPGFVGMPFPGVNVQIVPPSEHGSIDLQNCVVRADKHNVHETPGLEGTEGELLVKSPFLFSSYYNNPQATSDSFIEGWFRTGDTAVYEDGAFRIVGRTSVDIIKSGGYKISALDIEQHLLNHPDIAEVSVVGVPDSVWGQRVAAVISVNEGCDVTLPSLKKWCLQRMPKYHVPTLLQVVEKLPRNVMGKINKKEMIKSYFS